MPSELEALEHAEKELFRALDCLYTAVDSSVADDIWAKAQAYCLTVRPFVKGEIHNEG